VPLGPETLSYLSRSTLSFQWSAVERAYSYRLDLVPLNGLGGQYSFVSDGLYCGSKSEPADFTPSWDGRTRCATRDLAHLPVGLYQWRVEALDANGMILGSPSDWSYLIQR
jgi:hypothetical protein